MQDNLTLAEEEVVHTNECLHFEIKNPILRTLFYAFCMLSMLSLPALAQYLGG